MEVSLEVLGPTARALRVTVPQQKFAKRVEDRLRQLSRSLRIDGFRPGKVPVRVVRQQYLRQVYGEVMEALVSDSLNEALAMEKVRPVSDPKATVEEYGEDRPMRYQALFDVYPELAESRVEEMTLIDPDVTVEDADVENGMERLRHRNLAWEVVEKVSEAGDRVTFNYTHCGMDETLDRISGDSPELALVLEPGVESGEMVRGLHEHLKGMGAGDEKSIQMDFGETVQDGRLSGQTRQFRIRVREVREAVLPDWEDLAFVKKLGGPGATPESVRDLVRAHLNDHRVEMRREYLALQIIRELTEAGRSALPVPESLRESCLLMRRMEMEIPPERELDEDHPARRMALRDARGLTAFEALRALSAVEPDEQDERRAERAHARRFRSPATVREKALRAPKARELMRRQATWDALLRWTLDRARVNKERMTLEQLAARVES